MVRTMNDSENTESALPIRFLALGDSYTIGEAVRPEEGWPYQLVKCAGVHSIRMKAPMIIARTGWTTGDLIDGIRHAYPHGHFGLVSLLIGVNNLYRGWPLETFRTEFRALLGTALGFAGHKATATVVLSIPDWGATPFAEGRDRDQISRTTDEFNGVCRNEAHAKNVHYVDVTGISRKGLDDPGLLATDGLHPSGRMYALWAEAVRNTLFPDHD
jgi:lysophospholipase L1-like esterase